MKEGIGGNTGKRSTSGVFILEFADLLFSGRFRYNSHLIVAHDHDAALLVESVSVQRLCEPAIINKDQQVTYFEMSATQVRCLAGSTIIVFGLTGSTL